MKKIAIIGSGIGGLAVASLLAKNGYNVSVFEKNEQAGGRAGLLKEKKFTFDTGPSWFMMPDIFDRYFSEFGKKTSDLLKLYPLNPQYRVFFEDKTVVDIEGDLKKDSKTLSKFEKGIYKKLKKYLKESEQRYNLAVKSVLYKNADNPLNLISGDLAKNGSNLGIFLPMHRYVSKFFKSKKVQQIIEYNLVFLGCSPDNAPSLFSIMAHVDFNLGVWYPKGGIYELVRVLVNLGKKYGVKYYFNSPVEKIITSNDKVSSLIVKGKKISFDFVVSNADYKFTEDIIDSQDKRTYKKDYWDEKVYAPSAFLIYLGVKGKLNKLIHHNLYFGSDWKKHFREVFDDPNWSLDPSIYINKTSHTDKSVAPKNHENLMILVPISVSLPEDESWKESYSNFIIEFIEEKIGVKIKDRIVYKKVFSVSDFEKRFNSHKGNALGGLAHTLFQSSIFRPKNKSKKLKNLYFVGANTVPGIGVPPAVISSHLILERIQKDDKSKDI